EDGDDVGVLELGRGARLDLEALAVLLLDRGLHAERLHRHVAVEAGVVAAVDHPHAAAADPAGDHVPADAAPAGRRPGRRAHGSNLIRRTVMLSSPPRSLAAPTSAS